MTLPPAWPAGRPRVLVTDCWLANAGDAAIALATDALVRRLAPGASVVHAAYGVGVVGERYPELAWAPPLEWLVGTRWADPAPGLEHAGPALVAGADLVISQGGGFLEEAYAPWARIDALARAVALGVPLVVLGQTIGALQLAFARRMLGDLLRAARLVVVREPRSRLNVLSLGADPATLRLGTDMALALVPAPSGAPAPGAPAPGGPVSVVLGGDPLPGSPRPRTALAAALLGAVARRSPQSRLRVWSSVQGVPGHADDAEAAASAVAALPPADRARADVIDGHIDARGMIELAGDSSATVSMRLHPALVAAGQGVPTVLLLDGAKAGVLDAFGPGVAVVRGGRVADAEAAASALEAVQTGPVGLGPRNRLASMEAALADVLADVTAGVTAERLPAGALGAR